MSLELSEDRVEGYVQAFASHLCDDSGQDIQGLQGVASRLPDLLRTFALRMTAERASSESRAAGVFVRKNKIRIVQAFAANLAARGQRPGAPGSFESAENGSSTASGDSRHRAQLEGMPAEERVVRWFVHVEGVELDPPNLNDFDALPELDVDGHMAILEMDMARIDKVVNTTSYTWLKSAVQNRARLDFAGAGTLTSVRQIVAATLATPR
ncbi:hypothetical protein QBC34DRAFT_457745 [Podospora aff. communis PSN243]|uniref:Uncharacterized protein n=1 Tax=Podospora aff. communis PSN243 TaxID=3040156 RepID=A0AAV9GX14_9PEZI|nr:hypothetical protein QBC34DRAFT_457745 [Podospora aff. communis PSN243]